MATATKGKTKTADQPQVAENKGALAPVQQNKPPAVNFTLEQELEQRAAEYRKLLSPSQVALLIKRVIQAVNKQPKLLKADRRSFFNAISQAAADHLMPDGREGALVIYNTQRKTKDESGQEVWVTDALVQWQPMIFGIRKLVHLSRMYKKWETRVVYEGDRFSVRYGLDPDIEHVPELSHEKRGKPTHVYTAVRTKDDQDIFEVMTVEDCWKVWAKSSKQKDRKTGKPTGMWLDWPEEAFMKTVARHLGKSLDLSPQARSALERDDQNYTIDGTLELGETSSTAPERPQLANYKVNKTGGQQGGAPAQIENGGFGDDDEHREYADEDGEIHNGPAPEAAKPADDKAKPAAGNVDEKGQGTLLPDEAAAAAKPKDGGVPFHKRDPEGWADWLRGAIGDAETKAELAELMQKQADALHEVSKEVSKPLLQLAEDHEAVLQK